MALDSDLDTLVALNRDYIRSVQTSDVVRFDQLLAEDFLCSNPDGSLVDRTAFLKQTARPVTVADLHADEVNVRMLGDFAIISSSTQTLPVGSDIFSRFSMRRDSLSG